MIRAAILAAALLCAACDGDDTQAQWDCFYFALDHQPQSFSDANTDAERAEALLEFSRKQQSQCLKKGYEDIARVYEEKIRRAKQDSELRRSLVQ